jgi:hypothetical protein
MGQSSSSSEGKTDLRASTDWRPDHKDPKGTDATISVGDLLRTTTKTITYASPPPQIIIEPLRIKDAHVLHNVLTADECAQYIALSEEMGYEVSPLRNLDTLNSEQFSYNNEIRTSQRVLFDVTDQIADELNRRVQDHLPKHLMLRGQRWNVRKNGDGLSRGPVNRRWRFNKYKTGDFFKPHFDAGYIYGPDEKTLLTFILYLSDDFEGGETTFYPGDKKASWTPAEPGIELKVKPKVGSALIFWQDGPENPRHEGTPHQTEGKYKYILRSDVAYFKGE